MPKRKKPSGQPKTSIPPPPQSPPPKPSAAIVCAENIALLHLLHDIQDTPSRNAVPQSNDSKQGRGLSLARERSLCGALAFLASIDDNPNHIPAVCVEEVPPASSLIVRVAMNKGKPTDCNATLAVIKAGFGGIFRILSKIGDGDDTRPEHAVFTAVVAMCSGRILSRLRLRGRRDKQPIQKMLETVCIYYGLPRNMSTASSHLVENAREVMKLVHSWQQYQQPSAVEPLVEGIFLLSRVSNLKQLIEAIPNEKMVLESKKSLLNMVGKVSRYREFSRHLYRSAKKYPIVRRAEVCVVDLPHSAFERSTDATYTPNMNHAAVRARITTGTEDEMRHVCSFLKEKETAPDTFQSLTTKILGEAKVHAEVQLIYHFLLNPAEMFPRVICSSKDACWLCNAFINLGKMFHTPRCHGRLYPGWRLPAIPGLQSLAWRFNQELQNRLVRGYNKLGTPEGLRDKYPPPNESTLLTLTWSISTLPTIEDVGLPEKTECESQDQFMTNMKEIRAIPDDQQERQASQSQSRKDKQVDPIVATCADDICGRKIKRIQGHVVVEADEDDRNCMLSSSPESTSNDASEDAKVSGRLDPGKTSMLFSKGLLEVQVENGVGSDSVEAGRHLNFKICWIDPENGRKVREDPSMHIMEARLITNDEAPGILSGDGSIYIAHGEQIAQIQWTR